MTGWIALAGCLAIFATTALSGRHAAPDVDHFFHLQGVRRNAISLGIADITLGTGLAYILSATAQLGLAMLVLPLGLWCGYQLLGWLQTQMPASALAARGNMLLAVRDAATARRGGSRWLFDAAVTLPLILAFVLFVAYECFASSQIMAAFITPDLPWAPAAIGGAIVLVSGVNSIAGGAQSNWRNDHVLAGGILLLFAVVVVASIAAPAPATIMKPIGISGLMIMALGFLAAVSTQIYSLLNNYNASNMLGQEDARRIFRQVGVTVALLLTMLVLVGAFRPLDLSAGFPAALGTRLDALHLPPIGKVALQAVTVAGMVSVTFSSIDTLLVALAYFIRRHLLDRSTARAGTGTESVMPSRLLIAGLAFGVVPPLALLYLANPNLFTLLLTLGGGASIYAPLIALSALALRDGDAPPAWLLGAHVTLFIISGAVGVWCTLHAPQYVPPAGLAWLALAGLVAGVWYVRRRRAAVAAAR